MTYDHVDTLNVQRGSNDDHTGSNEISSINNLSTCTKTDFEPDVSACTSRTQSVNFDANELLSNTTFDVANLQDFENETETLLSTAACPSKRVTTDSDCSPRTYEQKRKGRRPFSDSFESRSSIDPILDSKKSDADFDESASSSDKSESDSEQSESDSNQSESDSNQSVGSVLPPKLTKRTRNKFCRNVGELKVASRKLLREDGSIDKDEVRRCLVQALAKDFNYPCTLSFFGGIRKNNSSFVTYANCLFVKHKIAFRFHILRIETPITVIAIQKTKSKKVSHTGAVIYRQLRGKERNENKQDMKYTTPRAFQQKVIGNLDAELVQDGNMQDMRLLSTYQKAKSEYNCRRL